MPYALVVHGDGGSAEMAVRKTHFLRFLSAEVQFKEEGKLSTTPMHRHYHHMALNGD